jgi:DNA polymerase
VLTDIREEIGECTRCRLHSSRTRIVFGEGSPQARLVFVGEGPGFDEDQQGRPFVGRAGKLLDKMIQALGLVREEVYIANVVKCRPPNNRTPQDDEIATCSPFLARQLEAIAPQVICALGACAAQTLLAAAKSISSLRNKKLLWRGIPLVCTFHPAYLLRNPSQKSSTWQDLLMAHEILTGTQEGN